ncbi:MAG: Mur ligase family protein, partial [bacterium]|nr:Mur ligase family protein [bacterium]
TGARGKTFTTALAGELCKAGDPATVVAGNMRISPLEYLDEIVASDRPMPIILELSSWLLESLDPVEKGPTYGVFTNIYADHLHRYTSIDDYAASKKNIFSKGGEAGIAVLNKDQEALAGLASLAPGKVMLFSLSELTEGDGVFIREGNVIARMDGIEETIMPLLDVHMEGDDNIRNVLSAIVIAKLHKVPVAEIARVASTFSTNDDRQEIVTDVSGVIYVNDALGTSPEITMNVLKRFGERGRSIHLISGGDVTDGDLKELIKVVEMVCKSVILLPGEGSVKFENEIATTEATQLLHAKTIEEAVKMASDIATSGDGVIFSPALGYTDESQASKFGEGFSTAALELN